MSRIEMIRAFQDEIYFVKHVGNSGEVHLIMHHDDREGTIYTGLVHQYPGERILSLEIDPETLYDQEDISKFLVMTDQHKIYRMEYENDSLCKVSETFDFRQHELEDDIIDVSTRHWFNVHITDRLFTIDGTVYNLKSTTN